MRNVGGFFIGTKSGHLLPHVSIVEAEALSFRDDLSWSHSLGYSHVIIEVDNNVLFDALTSSNIGSSYFSSIVMIVRTYHKHSKLVFIIWCDEM